MMLNELSNPSDLMTILMMFYEITPLLAMGPFPGSLSFLKIGSLVFYDIVLMDNIVHNHS